ncbi:MAG TPA: hypothetical protein VEB64_14935, partial [Azospirillaceae bacterium]|nr:hypothetical protein [Azospirillaceae bacterium]
MAPASANQSDSRLGPLFEQLKKTSSDGEAEVIESRIWEIWTEPPGGGEDVAALMTRGMLALAIDDYPTALAAFDEVVEKQPEFAEAWNKRATVHFLLDDIPRSIADIRQVLA